MTSGYVFWLASRASGTVALLLASAAVAAGLLQGSGSSGRARGPSLDPRGALRGDPRRRHAGILLGDGYLKPTVADLTLPFVSSYQPLWTSRGILSGWALVVLGLSCFAVELAGDVRVGGAAGLARSVQVQSPFDGSVLHSFELADAGVATSGIGRRSWLDERGRPAHHLLDPATGRPAYTGVVQATAIAPTALEAEVRAKAAVLSGPAAARGWLPRGGAVVLDDGRVEIIECSFGRPKAPKR